VPDVPPSQPRLARPSAPAPPGAAPADGRLPRRL